MIEPLTHTRAADSQCFHLWLCCPCWALFPSSQSSSAHFHWVFLYQTSLKFTHQNRIFFKKLLPLSLSHYSQAFLISVKWNHHQSSPWGQKQKKLWTRFFSLYPQKYISNCVFCSLANSTMSHHSQWCRLDLSLYSAFPQQHLTWFPSSPSCPIPLCLGSLFSTEQLESFSKC